MSRSSFSSHAPSLQELAQLSIQIHAEVQGLNGYEVFFEDDQMEYLRAGSDGMTRAVSELLARRSSQPDAVLQCRETRHDLRNKLAVVKGFADLMKMDLPQSHGVQAMLERVTDRCRAFLTVLDCVKITLRPEDIRADAA